MYPGVAAVVAEGLGELGQGGAARPAEAGPRAELSLCAGRACCELAEAYWHRFCLSTIVHIIADIKITWHEI